MGQVYITNYSIIYWYLWNTYIILLIELSTGQTPIKSMLYLHAFWRRILLVPTSKRSCLHRKK